MQRVLRKAVLVFCLASSIFGVISCESRQETPAPPQETPAPPIVVEAPEITIPEDRTVLRNRLLEEFVKEKDRRTNLYKRGWEDLVRIKALQAILQLPEGQGNEETQKTVGEIVRKKADEWVPEARGHVQAFSVLRARIQSEYPNDSVMNDLLKNIPEQIRLEDLPDPKEPSAEAVKEWASKHMNDFYNWFDPVEQNLIAVENRLRSNIQP